MDIELDQASVSSGGENRRDDYLHFPATKKVSIMSSDKNYSAHANELLAAGAQDDEEQTDDGLSMHKLAFGGSNMSNSNSADAQAEMREKIIHKEEKQVKKARICVGLAILLCAVAVSVSIYFFALNADKSTFELEVSHPSEYSDPQL